MFRIVKWAAFGSLALAAVGFAFFGSHFPSYVGAGIHIASKAGKERIPVEFELRRAETLIDGILPEIQACRKVIAEEEVGIESLKSEMETLGKTLERQEQKVKTMRSSLAAPEATFRFAGVTYSRATVEQELERSFDGFRNEGALMESKRRLLESREKSLAATRQKLDVVRAEKANLETVVQNLHAQLRQVQALEATSKVALDSSSLTRAKQVLGDCQRRLDVAQRMIESEALETPAIEFGKGPDRDLLSEIDRVFEEKKAAPEAAKVAAASH